jgi:hypothetical protein
MNLIFGGAAFVALALFFLGMRILARLNSG